MIHGYIVVVLCISAPEIYLCLSTCLFILLLFLVSFPFMTVAMEEISYTRYAFATPPLSAFNLSGILYVYEKDMLYE